MQKCRPPSPQDVGMILLSTGDGILICFRLSDATASFIKSEVKLSLRNQLWPPARWGRNPCWLLFKGPFINSKDKSGKNLDGLCGISYDHSVHACKPALRYFNYIYEV
jgi:hypothetical protein